MNCLMNRPHSLPREICLKFVEKAKELLDSEIFSFDEDAQKFPERFVIPSSNSFKEMFEKRDGGVWVQTWTWLCAPEISPWATRGCREVRRVFPGECPCCRSRNITGGSFEVDETVIQDVWCHDCGAEWRDVYCLRMTLIDVEPNKNQQVPPPSEPEEA